MEEELRATRDAAEAGARSKATFLANMSHEIRTPMNGVLGFADLLLESELSNDQRKQVQLIRESGRSMVALLNDILDLSKIDARQMTIEHQPFDLRHKIGSALRLMRISASQQKLSLESEIDESIADFVMGDKMRLGQILSNLVGNAVKFTEMGTVRVTARIRHDHTPAMLEICVSDTGIGIDQDRLEDIFDEFAQADGSTVRRFGGTGLGLAISRQLAKLLGGSLTATSTPGVGSEFVLTLPYEPAEAVHPVARTQAGQDPQAAQDPQQTLDRRVSEDGQDTRRILVVEDHEINRRLMSALLSNEGYQFEVAEDGVEAIEQVEAFAENGNPFSLVLMDIQMPRLDGLEATRQLRKRGFSGIKLPIVAMTANAFASDVEECLAAGMQAHLAKPVRLDDLRRALRTWLARDRVSDKPGEPHPSVEAMRASYNAFRDRTMATARTCRAALPEITAEAGTELRGLLHQIKGMAGMFGEPLLGDSAADIEQAFRSGGGKPDRDELAALLDKFLLECDRCKARSAA